MAFYSINNFWFDEETGNIFLTVNKEADVSYAYSSEYSASDIYQAQIYLDGGMSLIGKTRPPSEDGTIEGGNFGKTSADPASPEAHPLADAPE